MMLHSPSHGGGASGGSTSNRRNHPNDSSNNSNSSPKIILLKQQQQQQSASPVAAEADNLPSTIIKSTTPSSPMFHPSFPNAPGPSSATNKKGKGPSSSSTHHHQINNGSLAASLSSVNTDTTKEMTTSSSCCGGGGSVTTHTTIDDSNDFHENNNNINAATADAEDLLDILENASIDLNEQIKSPPRLGSLSQNMTEERRKQLLHQSMTSRSQTSSSSHKDRTAAAVLHFEMEDDDDNDFNGNNRAAARSHSISNDSFDFSDVGWGGGKASNAAVPPPERRVQRNESFDNCSTMSELPFSMTKLQSRSNLNYNPSNHDKCGSAATSAPPPQASARATTASGRKPTMSLDEALAFSPPKTPVRRKSTHEGVGDDVGAVSPLTVSSAIENSCGTAYQRSTVQMGTGAGGVVAPPTCHEFGDDAFASPPGKWSGFVGAAHAPTNEVPLIPPTSPDENEDNDRRRESSGHRRSLRVGSRAAADGGRNRTVPLASPAGRGMAGAASGVTASGGAASPGGFLLAAARLQRSYGKLPEANDATDSCPPQEDDDNGAEGAHPSQPKSSSNRVMSKNPSSGRIAIPSTALFPGTMPHIPPTSANGKVVRKIKVRAKDLASLVASQPRAASNGQSSGNVSLSGSVAGSSASVVAASPTTILNKVDLRKVQDAFRKIRSKTPTPTSRSSARKVKSDSGEDVTSSVVPASSRSRSRSRRSQLENSSSTLGERSSRSKSRAGGSRRSLASSDAEGDLGMSARRESVVSQPPTTPSTPSRSALTSRSRSRSRPPEAAAPASSSPSSSSRSRSRCRPADPDHAHDHKDRSERRESHKERSKSRPRPSESSKMGTEPRLYASKSNEDLPGSPQSRRRERSSEVTSPTASKSFRGHTSFASADPASSPSSKRRSRSLVPIKTPKKDPEGSAARDSESYPPEATGAPKARSASLAPRPGRGSAAPSAMDSSEHQSTIDLPPQAPTTSRIHSPRLVLKANVTSSHTAMDASDHHSQVDRPVSMPLRRASCVVPGALKTASAQHLQPQPAANVEGDQRRRRSSSRKPARDDEPVDEERRRRSSSRKHAQRSSTTAAHEEEARRHRSKSRGRSSGTCSALKVDPSHGRKESSASSPSSSQNHHRSIHNMIVEGHSSINSSVAAVAHPQDEHEPHRRGVERTCSAVAREVGITPEQLQMLQSAGFHISSAQQQRRM